MEQQLKLRIQPAPITFAIGVQANKHRTNLQNLLILPHIQAQARPQFLPLILR
jgi:hypothetical protein